MWRPLLTFFLVGCQLALIVTSEGRKLHRSRRQAEFTCEDSETMVRPPFEYEDGVRCKEVIGRPPDRYKDIYRKACQRWLGLSEIPESVANSYVDQCTEYSNGTARYMSRVCCFGVVSGQRCFTCNNATNTYECTYGGQVITCPAGEVCMTQSLNYKHNTYSRGYRFAQCAASSQCSELESKNGQTCRYYIPSPNCTFCCSGKFCNYMLSDRYLWAFDDACKRNPCYNGGTCVLNSTYSSGYYCLCKANYTGSQCLTALREKLNCQNGGILSYINNKPICYCPISKTGKECELDAAVCQSSTNYTCMNGGICYNHTAFGSGLRCLCPPGWVGAHCEQEAKLECAAKDGYYNFTYSYRSGSTYFNRIDCTYKKAYVEKYYRKYYLYYCRSHMSRPGVKDFEEGVNGLVGQNQLFSLYSCSIGDGLIRYHYHMCCPSCYSNPCLNGGWCQQNSEWDYVCQCRFGYEGRNCENKIYMCVISGDPHYKTIDGKHIHFQGPCKYNLLSRSQANNGLPDFKIFGRNERRGSNTRVSYPDYFEVHYQGYVIKLKKGGIITVNNEVVYPDCSYLPHFKITKNGQFIRFESSDGLIVDYDGSWIALLKVPEKYRKLVDGLCGNYDGDADNDMMTSSKSLSTSYAEVGNSWQVDDPDDPQCSGPDDDNPPECNANTEKLVQGNDYCGLLQDVSNVFGTCLQKSGQLAGGFYESCKYDVCANQANMTAAKESACAILSAFATHCQSIQIPVFWRTIANCPLACPRGMEYKEKTSACAATCQTPDGPEICSYPDTENCVCPDDMVVINGTCQKPEMCKCPGGHEIGSSWLSTDCSVRFECEACKECSKRKVARVYKYNHTCIGDEVCQNIDGVGKCQSCQQADGGWSSWSKWSECNKATREQKRHRSCNNPTPKCGGKTCSGSDEESRKCIPVPDSAIIPEPPACEPDFDFQRACDQCDLFKNPNMFVANPCSCGTFYQCSKNQLFGYYDVYEKKCSPCTCWSQAKLACDHDPEKKNPDHDKCVNVITGIEEVENDGIYCSLGERRFQAIPSDPQHYIDRDAGDIEMPCPPGTLFSVQDCLCVHGGDNLVQREEEICLEFDDKEHPLKTDQGVYVTWSKSSNSVLEDGVEGTALRFNGDRLEIPYYNNKEMRTFSISLWYKRYVGRSEKQNLVSKGDCTGAQQATLEIQTKSESIGAKLRTSSDKLDDVNDIPSSANKWHHVVMTYDGDRQKFYLDGQLKDDRMVTGIIPGIHCPLLIGSSYDSSYFYGLMDKVCLFDEALSYTEVKKMFEQNKMAELNT